MAPLRQSSDDDNRQQEARYFIKHAATIPQLLRSLQERHKDLDNLLTRLENFIASIPRPSANKLIPREDIMWKAVVELFSAAITGTAVDILLSDAWYTPSQDSSIAKLEVLARALRVLLKLLCLYVESEHDRAKTHFGSGSMPTQNAEGEIVNLFKKLWQHRHSILPIPPDDRNFWELKKENMNTDGYETLETAVIQLVLVYGEAFMTRLLPQRSEFQLTPKYVLESGLLHLHCLARTQQFKNFAHTVLTPPLFLASNLSLEPLNHPLWLAVTEDTIERKGVERMLLMRLLDDNIIDDPLAALIATAYSYVSVNQSGIDDALGCQLLHRSTRALERQICRGTLQDLDGPKYSNMAMEFCGILRICFGTRNAGSYFYQGDISKLDVIGVLAYSSVSIMLYETNKLFDLLALVSYYTTIAEKYKTIPNYRGMIARLGRRARMCVPSTIHALQQTPIPAEPQNARDLIAQLIQAWTDYAAVLGISPESASVNEDLEPSLERFLFRTCALPTCSCRGKKPAHKMRACMGCWEVVYCGEKCQTEHWEKWGHREKCQELRIQSS